MTADALLGLAAVCLRPDSGQDDAWQADHYTVFTHEAMPVASLFLEPDGMLGGAITERAFVEAGPAPDASFPADHAGSLLMEAARRVEQDGQSAGLAFVAAWLTPWMPLCTDAIMRLPVHPAFHAWAQSVDDLMIRSCEAADHAPALVPGSVPDDILSDERTDLARIGRHLATPAASGLFLTHADIRTIARRFNVPTGFGSRARGLEGLFRSAVTYESMADVCMALETHVDRTEALWYGYTCRMADPGASPWSGHLVQTRHLLRRLATEANG